ncbi:MAG: ABC transporter ATP-binding protein [Lachnospiraceae bacterium]|nr:ABC transporter ATP-binding protein [Lachnospiraceae bacterium]
MAHTFSNFLTEEEKKNAPKMTWPMAKRILGYVKPYWKQVLLALAAITASAFLTLYPSILAGQIIDDGLIGRDFHRLVELILLSLAVLIASDFLTMLVSYLNIWNAQKVTYDMRNTMYRHLQKMSQRFFTNSRQGDIITRMTSDIDGVQNVIANTCSKALSNVATLVLAVAAMMQKSWQLAVIGMIIVPLFSIPIKRAGKMRWSVTLKAQSCNDEINQILNETMSSSGQLLVKLFSNEEYEYDRYREANDRLVKLNIKESVVGRWFRTVLSTFTNAGPMLIYLAGGILMILYGNTDVTVGDVTVMVTLLGKMYLPLNQLLNLQVDITRSMALFGRIFSYLDMPAEIDNAPDAVTPRPFRGIVDFRQVCFSYDGTQQILHDISFSVKEHQMAAIVGPSGCGKSTIISLILRLYDATAGEVAVSGVDVRRLDLQELRRHIGAVTQDTYLFNGTIRENLLYAKQDATEEELIDACRRAQIHDFITSLPDGYDTRVGNRGMKLSGGEKQRISIARVILKDPSIIIFDEATSALDSLSENSIQEAIEPLLHDRTSIVIAHRLSTIVSADRIFVVEHGRIVEEGTHKELVSQGGVYAELYETQFKAAAEDTADLYEDEI